MRRTLVMLCRVGVLIPPVFTEFALVTLLVFMAVILLRTHNFSIPTFATLSLMAGSLGFSLLKVFRHLWATIVAATVSVLWLGFGIETLFDVRVNPEKYRGGDGADAVLFLIPFGAIGVVCWLVLFFAERQARHLTPASENFSETAD
jgi:hypothetical protein